MKHFIALTLLASPAYAGSYAGPIFEDTVDRPRIERTCDDPVYSERTGEILHFQNPCRKLPEDGDNKPPPVTCTMNWTPGIQIALNNKPEKDCANA